MGDTVAPYLRHAGDVATYDFKPIATTDIVSAPRDFLNPDEPTVLVSFARSGNSPESLAAVDVARKFVKNIKFLNITCAPEGKLAVESAGDPDALTLLIPRANDKGLRHDRQLQLHGAAHDPHLRHRLRRAEARLGARGRAPGPHGRGSARTRSRPSWRATSTA